MEFTNELIGGDWDFYDYENEYNLTESTDFVNLTLSDLSDTAEHKSECLSRTKKTMLCFFVLVYVLGTLGNASVIFIVSKFRKMQTVTNLYLSNLSVAQLLFLHVCLPTMSISYAFCRWPFGNVICKIFSIPFFLIIFYRLFVYQIYFIN